MSTVYRGVLTLFGLVLGCFVLALALAVAFVLAYVV